MLFTPSYPMRAFGCFAREFGGAWYEIRVFEEMLAQKGIVVSLPKFANADERKAFLDSDIFAKITNEYYQTLSEDEKSVFMSALSYKVILESVPVLSKSRFEEFKTVYVRKGYDINTLKGQEKLKTTAKIFSILEDDSKFDYAGLEVLKGALEFGVLSTDFQRIKAISQIKSLGEEAYVEDYLSKVEEGRYPKFDLTLKQIKELELDEFLQPEQLMRYLTNEAKEKYSNSDVYRLFTLEREGFARVVARYIGSMQSEDLELMKENRKDLELLLSSKGIEMQFAETINNAEEFLASDKFRSLVNSYYETVEDKNDFVRNICTDYMGIPKEGQVGLQIFSAIEDEAKFKYVSTYFLKKALDEGLLKTDSHRLAAVIKIDKEHRDLSYFEKIQNGEFEKFNFSSEQIKSILENKSKFGAKLITALLSSTSHERIIEYLGEKPDDISFCMNTLVIEEAASLLKSISDEAYKAKLLLSIESDPELIGPLYPNIADNFTRGIITAEKVRPNFLADKPPLKRIEEFLEIKEKFLKLPENERVSFICSLPFDDLENLNSNPHRDVNEMKKSLLSYIDNPSDRQRVIESMACYVEPDIEKYVNLAQQMIREYVDDVLKLNKAQRERMEIAFRANDVFFTDYGDFTTNGRADYVRKEITIANHSRGDTQNIILDMLHEYSHVFSMANYLQDAAYHVGHTFEEGMADTFSEQVANYYFSKYKEAKIEGEIFQPSLPLVSQSSYEVENGWVKSMLYPLALTGHDKEAIREFVFGDKSKFFDLALGDDFSQTVKHDFAGNPLDVEITTEELVRAHPATFSDINADGLYLQKNNLIYTLERLAQSMGEKDEKLSLEGNEVIDRIEEGKIRFGQISAVNYALEQDIKLSRDLRERDDNSIGG